MRISRIAGTLFVAGALMLTLTAPILRVTHGQIFPAIADIRATTENTLVRQLADQANDTVLDHITALEQTGLVNFDQVLFRETSPPKLPAGDMTPPVPQPGEPTVALSPPAGFTPPPSTKPSPQPALG